VGSLALAGIPPLSGFWSKDTILSAVHEASHETAHAGAHGTVAAGGHDETHTGPADSLVIEPVKKTFLGLTYPKMYSLLFWMGCFTAFLTAFYTFRAFFMTFHGPEKIPHEAGHHAHESPPVMCLPLFVLAVGAIFLGGLLGHVTGIFDSYLDKAIPGIHEAASHHGTDWFVMGLSSLIGVAGIGLAFVLYGSPSTLPGKIAAAAGPLTRLSQNKFYLDEVYQVLFVWPLWLLAELSRLVDWLVIDVLLVGGVSRVPALVGRLPRPIQNGLVQFYALAMTLAMAVLLWALLTKQG
jgi:NADH-quinone oxidoreductase subunit L